MQTSLVSHTGLRYQEVRHLSLFASDSTRMLDKLAAERAFHSDETARAAFQFWLCFHILYNKPSRRRQGVENLLAACQPKFPAEDERSYDAHFLTEEERFQILRSARYYGQALCKQKGLLAAGNPATKLLSNLVEMLPTEYDAKCNSYAYTLLGIQSALSILALESPELCRHRDYQNLMANVHTLLAGQQALPIDNFAECFSNEIAQKHAPTPQKKMQASVFSFRFLLDLLIEMARSLWFLPKSQNTMTQFIW